MNMKLALLRTLLAQEGLTASNALKRLKLTDSRGVFFIEVTPQQAAALKLVPGGSEFTVDRQAGKIFGASWSKRGGYADKISQKFHQQLKVLGFHLVDSTTDAHPADFYTASSGTYKDSEGTVAYSSSHYGQVKSENSFSISVHFKFPVKILGDEAEAEHQEEFERQAPARSAFEVLKKTPWINDPRVDRNGRAVGFIDKAVLPEWARPYVVEAIVYTSGGLPRWRIVLNRTFMYGQPPYFGSYAYTLNLGSPGYEWEGGVKSPPEDIEKALTRVIQDVRNVQPDDLWGRWLEKESLAVALGAKPKRG